MGKKDRRRGTAAPQGATTTVVRAGRPRRLVWIGLALALTLVASIGWWTTRPDSQHASTSNVPDTQRQARRLRGQVHLRARAAAAVPRRTAGRPPAGARRHVGRAPRGRRRPALVPPVSGREARLPRRAALDATVAELELHVRRLPLDERAQGLRRGEGRVRHAVVRDQRRLRVVPRAGLGASRVGEGQAVVRSGEGPDGRARRAARRRVADRSRERQREAHAGAPQRPRDRSLRSLPCASGADCRRLAGGRRADGPLPAVAAVAGPLSRRRPAARRGVHLGFVPAKPDAPRGRHVQRLPRPAHAEAARAGQRGVRAVPPRVEVRRQGASLPSRRHARRRVRQLPHAGDHLHGGRSASRPQPAGPAARPVREARHPERLQRLPPREHGAVVGGLGRALVRRAAAQRSSLRRGDRRRPPRRRGRRARPRGHRHERRLSADRARVGRRAARALSGRERRCRGAQRAARRRSAGAARRPGRAAGGDGAAAGRCDLAVAG